MRGMDTETFIERVRKLGPLGGHPRFYELLLEIAELHTKKNHDYAKDNDPLSNLRLCESFGVPAFKGTLVRLSDKWSRITELSKKDNMVKSESIIDTLMDNAIYSLLAILLFEEQQRGTTKTITVKGHDSLAKGKEGIGRIPRKTRATHRTRRIRPL